MHAIQELLGEHEDLRAIMDSCEFLADEIDAGRRSLATLVSEVGRLRVALTAHNQHEEVRLPAILRAADASGDLEELLSSHLHEHRTMHASLASTPTGALRATIENLRDHLAIEETYFAIAASATRGALHSDGETDPARSLRTPGS